MTDSYSHWVIFTENTKRFSGIFCGQLGCCVNSNGKGKISKRDGKISVKNLGKMLRKYIL
jgi:hypothetical protein